MFSGAASKYNGICVVLTALTCIESICVIHLMRDKLCHCIQVIWKGSKTAITRQKIIQSTSQIYNDCVTWFFKCVSDWSPPLCLPPPIMEPVHVQRGLYSVQAPSITDCACHANWICNLKLRFEDKSASIPHVSCSILHSGLYLCLNQPSYTKWTGASQCAFR